MEQQRCPICHKQVLPVSRYPKYICQDCEGKITDEAGNPVHYHNTSLLGSGIQGIYRDTEEIYDSKICYIADVKCKAIEARFGGIVTNPISQQ